MLELFHPAINNWFKATFREPTPAQQRAWPAIRQHRHTLIAAPTGSGKTLAAFMTAIDELVQAGLQQKLQDETYVLYISPLKALSNDIQKNLQLPLQAIADELNHLQLPSVDIRAVVRTGDTPAAERLKMRKQPPHILVTTPESLFILLTSNGGRQMLKTVRTVIVDEIHALAGNKRGAHLSLSLERLQALVEQHHGSLADRPLIRIGLSATQKPIETVARFLVGNRNEPCTIVDSGSVRKRDLAITVPGSPLAAVMATEVWQEVYDRLAELITEHRTTLIFVNNRRLAERAARYLAERIGENNVTAHHGSLAREHRLQAEQRLKHGELKAMVATSSLELGIDIGDIDLVCQIGSPRSISAFLQRVGRSGHAVTGLPKGRLFPTTRDDLAECAALLDAVRRQELDTLTLPDMPLDVLAQQIIAEVSGREWHEEDLYQQIRQAYPYHELTYERFDELLTMLAEGFSTRRGRRSAYLYRDAVNKLLRARKGAALTAVTNAGAIPDQFDYDVILEPQGEFIGTLNEDFAFESLPGDIFQLGNTSYRILRVERGIVRVEDAYGQPPNIPFWFGEAPGRSNELSHAVSRLREEINRQLEQNGTDKTAEWLVNEIGIAGQAAVQLAEYFAATKAALQIIPTQQLIVFERFFDEAGDQHIVIHSPYGSRINRAWGLALRKRFCRKFNFELQAAALEDSIVISLGATHSFPLDEVKNYVKSENVREVVTQAMLPVPLFMTRWRWAASIALAIKRNRNGRRVPAQFQRMDAEDLISVVFPDQLACQDNIVGAREIPDHPLVNQTIADCMTDAMDIEGLEKILQQTEKGEIKIISCDLGGPSPLAQEILTARPYAFLDDAPAEERRTQAVAARNFTNPADAAKLATLDPSAITKVRDEAWPNFSNPDELHDALMLLGFLTKAEVATDTEPHITVLTQQARATCIAVDADHEFWVCAEKLPLWLALFPDAQLHPLIQAAGSAAKRNWSREEALVEILRGRLECLGPTKETTLANTLGLTLAETQAALHTLEQQGSIMQGYFSAPDGPLEWCERGLLARIHRYTQRNLRDEIKPVSLTAFMRFLFEWHNITPDRPAGENALINTLQKLEGFNIAASAWETDILPARLAMYSAESVDKLCTSGRYIWIHFPQGTQKNAAPFRNTPVTLLARNHRQLWLTLIEDRHDAIQLSSAAQQTLNALEKLGASFFIDLVQETRLLRTQVEKALAELAAQGLVNADTFAGLRALITPAGKRNNRRHSRRTRPSLRTDMMDNAGRWNLLRQTRTKPAESQNEYRWLSQPYETLEHIAKTLLLRYGVIFRKLLIRENLLPPWRELLYVLRRLEAQGQIRGGRFIDGCGGEQFALPEAVGLLRKQRDNDQPGLLTVISAVDPLNLTGTILPGQRIAAIPSNRLLFRDGVLLGWQTGKTVHFNEALSEEQAWQARNLLIKSTRPLNYVSRIEKSDSPH